MENHRNNALIAQEGCPSLDFTLLDRPSNSMVSAPGSTAPLFPGENPLSSFDFLDGAGVESHNDHSFPGHRSYMPEAAKDALRRNVSMQPGPLQRQGLGEQYFFGQENQQPYSKLGSRDDHVQSQNISLGGPNPQQLGAGNMPPDYTLGGKTPSCQSTSSRNTGSLSPSIHAVHSSAGGVYADDRKNQITSMQQYPSDSQNSLSKFSMFGHQLNDSDIASAIGLHHQDQFHRYASQNTTGTASNETLNRTFPTNQLPNGPALVPPEARPGGPTRGFGMTELQLLRQQALQSKQQQALQFKQQQAMRMQQQEAMRAQQEATRQEQKMQQEAVILAQKQEALRMQQQQEATRLQQQKVMQSQQQEVFRMQQQALYLQQQGAARTEEQNAALWSQDQVGMPSKQQNTVPIEQQQAIWSQQQKTVWHQQGSSEQRKNLQSQQQWAWLTQQQQTLPPYQQQPSLSNQHQALQFQKAQALQAQQPHIFQNHQRMSGSQQQHLAHFQQQSLQTQQQQAPPVQQKHVSSLQCLTLQPQQELFEASQQVLAQNTCAEFSGTSYSALLHGPDTPPSRAQSGGETLFSDLESNTAPFPLANSHTAVWPTYGPSSSYQGLPREHSVVQNSVESQNVRSALHPCDGHNFAVAEDEGRQSTQSEFPIVGSRAVSPAKPAFGFNKPEYQNAELGGFGSAGNSSFEGKNKHQVPAKPLLQTSQYLSGQSPRSHGLSSGRIQTNLSSQSPNHYQGLQSSQQRSWECLVQKHGVSKPSFPEVHPSVSNGISTIESSILERGFQKTLSSIGTGRMSPGDDSQRLESKNPGIPTGYKQRLMFNSAVGEVARARMDEEGCQCPGSQSIITSLDTSYHPHHDSDANNNTWANRVVQLGTPMVQLPVNSAAPPPDNMSQAMLNVNQGTLSNIQVPPKTTTVRNALCSQESIVWKENDISRQMSSYFSKSEGYSQGFWKQHTSFPESGCVLDSTCEPSSRHVNDSTWKHNFQSYKSNFDAKFNMQTASLISMNSREQDNTGQLTHEKQLLGHEDIFQQVRNSFSVNGAGNQPITNTVEAFSQGTASNGEIGQFYKLNTSNRLQGSTVDKVRISELPMDPSSSRGISLAHLRQSQPSSPLSPQHVKLGLGPANLPQNIQQVRDMSTLTSSQIEASYLKNHGPSSNMEAKNFLAGMPQGCSGHESPAGSRSDPNQGIAASVNGMPSQNNVRPSSALSNSSSFSKESADSEALPPSSIKHGVERYDFSQGMTSLTGNAFHGVATNVGCFEEESSSTLHGKLKRPPDNHRQPSHSASSGSQGKFSAGPRHANTDGSLRVLQNHQIINMALKQLGNKTQAANLAGLLTTLKTSLSEHSKSSGDHENSLPGLGESGYLLSGSAQKGGNATAWMENSQMMRKPAGPVPEDCSPHLKAAGLSFSNEDSPNCKIEQEEESGSATTGLLSDLQRKSRESLSINGSKSHALQSGEGARLSVLRTLNAGPSQVEGQVRVSKTQPASFGQDQYLQQQDLHVECMLPHQISKGEMVDTVQTARSPSTANAVDKPIDSQLKPLKSSSMHGYVGKVAVGPGNGTFVETAIELERAQQQKASVLEFVSQSNSQSGDILPPRHGQLSRQIAIDALISSSSPCTGTEVDGELANDTQPLCNLRLPSDITQPAHISHLSSRQEDTDAKVEDTSAGMNGNIASLSRLPVHQISPSKTSLLATSAVHPKKRKKPVPLLIPWYIAATQPRDSLPSTSEMELMWANMANRLSDKDDGDVRKENVSSGIKARRRLRLTTQLMQQLIPPLSGDLMHGNTPVDNDCATFSLAKFALEDACRLVTNTRREATSAHDCAENKNMPLHGQQGRTWGMAKSIAVTRCVESFMERARGLDSQLARIETSSSVSDLHRDIVDTEKLAIVNRLAKHHGTSFTMDSSEFRPIENICDVTTGIWKPSPKKYVIANPMPRTLPGVKCLSL